MKKVFISNVVSLSAETDIVFNNVSTIEDKLKNIDVSSSTIYIIDVHTELLLNGKSLKLLDQGGVIIYRFLLHKFKDHQDKLKVVFYSPLTQKQLVSIKPENFILNLLPFIECTYLGKDTFEGLLEDITTFYESEGWPQFNNASENLLSGWAIVNKKAIKSLKYNDVKIKLNDVHKLLIFDDEAILWKAVYYTLFRESDYEIAIANTGKGKYVDTLNYIFENGWNFENEKKVINPNIKNFMKNKWLDSNYLIITDFYLTENHLPETLLSPQELKQKSGSKLFKLIREINPAKPIVFHTTSNKVFYYKYFDQLGVDDWIVKSPMPYLSENEKVANFEYFQATLRFFYKPENLLLYNKLQHFINEIHEIKALDVWWKNPTIGNDINKINPDIIYRQLFDSFYALRRYLNREYIYERATSEFYDKEYSVVTSIINSLYKVKEYIDNKLLSSKKYVILVEKNWILNFLEVVRNLASHIREKEKFEIADALVYFDLIILYLKEIRFTDNPFERLNFRFVVNNDFREIKTIYGFDHSLVILYLTVYLMSFNRHITSEDFHSIFKNNLENKINELNRGNSWSRIKQALEKFENDTILSKDLVNNLLSITTYTNDLIQIEKEVNEKLNEFQNNNKLNLGIYNLRLNYEAKYSLSDFTSYLNRKTLIYEQNLEIIQKIKNQFYSSEYGIFKLSIGDI